MPTQIKSTTQNPLRSEWLQRARYFNSGNAFALKLSPVPSVQFVEERDHAFAKGTATGLIDMDLRDHLETDFAATTPFAMSRYLRIRNGESFTPKLNASVQVICILQGSGSSCRGDSQGDETTHWNAGDILLLPGSESFTHKATHDTVAWFVTDEPVLAFLGLAADRDVIDARHLAIAEPVHYLADDLQQQLRAVYDHPDSANFPGYAVVLSHNAMEHTRNIHPTLTLALNSLPARSSQQPHMHNSMALTMCIQGKNCFSKIDGVRKDWQQHAVMVTPPGAVHSHHNDGEDRMQCLIIQDGALHYYGRTMGFSFAEHPDPDVSP